MDPVVTTTPNQKGGFTFTYAAVGAPPIGCSAPGTNSYLINATPVLNGINGIRSFCSDEVGTIHHDPTGTTAGTQTACEALPSLR